MQKKKKARAKNPESEWVTQAEFARRAGVARPEVLQSIRRGRISYKTVSGRKLIDVTTELPNFLSTVRHAGHMRDDAGTAPKKEMAAKTSTKKNTRKPKSDDAPNHELEALPIAQARQMREQYHLWDAALDYERKAGTIVPVSDVIAEWRRIGTQLRKAVMNIPDRVSPLVAAEPTARACWQILDRECRQILEDLANVIASSDLPDIDSTE